MLFLPISAMVSRMVVVFARVSNWRVVGLWSGCRNCGRRGPRNQLVELTPVKPNTPALGTIVNFNTLAFGHQEG